MFKIGEKLLIEKKYDTEKETLKCMVVEIGKDSFYIDYPVNEKTGKLVFLMDGTQIKATYMDGQQGIIMFETEVFKKVKRNIPMVELLLPPKESFIKIQRRQFLRLQTRLDVAIHPIGGEFAPFRTVTEDISAGGAALRLRNTMNLYGASQLLLWIALPLHSGEIVYLKMRCKVVRIVEANEYSSLLSIQFVEPEKYATQTIIRYIFEKQVNKNKTTT